MITSHIWGIHSKQENSALDESRPHICIGWSGLGDLKGKDKEDIEKTYEAVWPDSKNKKFDVGQINSFINETKIGDYVIYSDKRVIHIGKITSDYYFYDGNDDHQDKDYANERKVEWLKHNPLEVLSKEAYTSLNSSMSYFSMNSYTEEISSLLDGSYLEKNENYLRLQAVTEDIDPGKYDGSYLLVKKVVESYIGVDFLTLDNKDLELIYFSTIGTWKSSFANKKERIINSHLPNDKKNKLVALVDDLEKTTNSGHYQHKENGKNIMGMFGTGMGSLRVNNDDVKRLIELFIKVCGMQNSNQCAVALKNTIQSEIKGAKAGVVSTILHCLQPTIFPIFNGSTFNSRLFEKLGILIENANEVTSYVDNMLRIQEFRDKHFAFKNYILNF